MARQSGSSIARRLARINLLASGTALVLAGILLLTLERPPAALSGAPVQSER